MLILTVSPTYATDLKVSLPDYDGFGNVGSDRDSIVYSGVRFGSDGKIYRAAINGQWQWTGQSWLRDGAASGYYLVRSVVGGSALASDGGTLQVLSTNRDYYITTSLREKFTDIEFKISSDVSGTPVLATKTYRLSCERERVLLTEGDAFSRPTWIRARQ